MAGRDKTLPLDTPPQLTPVSSTTTQPRRASQVVGTASCLPSRKVETPTVPVVDAVISAPNSFKHAVKVVFNEELSRYLMPSPPPPQPDELDGSFFN
jgi:hypothetical protein